jgi:two-component system OmpR family sensor kinase
LSSWWRSVRQLPGRTPLRVKLVAALLALVAVALAVISVSSLAVFGNYLQDRADSQLQYLYAEARNSTTLIGGHNPVFTLPGYVAELRDSQGKLLSWGSAHRLTIPGPQVPAGRAWLKANSGKLTTVPSVSGNDNWRIISGPQAYHACNPFTEQCGATRTGTLVVGVDLGNINQTIGWLARIDLLVSLIIMAALAVAGVAAVRASLRPLTDIEQTARDIAAGDLTRRVPDRDPRTEVGRLGRSLNTMLSQIEAAFHARARSEAAARQSEERMRQFIADASHELRTPLTAIRGYAEYYRQRGGAENGAAAGRGELPDGTPGPAAQPGQPPAGDDLADAGLDRIMDRVEQESARMGALVEELLLLARLDQQRPIEHRLVDLLTLAADAVQDARMIATDRSVDLEVGSGPAFLVLGDEARLRQVISNLMSNALMHTPGGTPIHVRLRPGLLAPATGTDGPATISGTLMSVSYAVVLPGISRN